MVALGLLWQGVQRRSAALAGLAGVVHAAALPLLWEPEVGLAAGAALWLVAAGSGWRRRRMALAAIYVLPPLALSLWMVFGIPRPGAGGLHVSAGVWTAGIGRWLSPARFAATLVLGGVVTRSRQAGGWNVIGRGPLGLVLAAGAGAAVAGLCRPLEPYSLAAAGAALVLAAGLAVAELIRARPPAGVTAPALLGSAVAVAALSGAPLAFRRAVPRVDAGARVILGRAIEPGSRIYVWGGLGDMIVYSNARAIPAVPQIGTWMLEAVGPPMRHEGPRPPVATLERLDRDLAQALPRYVVAMDEVSFLRPADAPQAKLSELPRFGPLLGARYRVVQAEPKGRLYKLLPPGP
jgi:hypothetical protein